MKLITEEIEQAEYIVEETDGKKNYAIKGIFMQSDIKNKNGRPIGIRTPNDWTKTSSVTITPSAYTGIAK